jgi:hypothetical protein
MTSSIQKMCRLSYRTMSRKSESVIEEEGSAWKMGVVLSEYHSKDTFNADEYRLFCNLLIHTMGAHGSVVG